MLNDTFNPLVSLIPKYRKKFGAFLYKLFLVSALQKIAKAVSMDLCCQQQKSTSLSHIQLILEL
jgi:hypothetical protein